MTENYIVCSDHFHNSNDGATYVFEKPTGDWEDMTQTQTLESSLPSGYYGIKVAVSNDNIFVQGVYYVNSGWVFVYSKNGETWEETDLLYHPDPNQELTAFGHCLESYGDYVFIGAPYDANHGGKGSLFVFGPQPLPSIQENPIDVEICETENTLFSISSLATDSYQWQVDDGNGFIDITNNAVYSNATTHTLLISEATFDMDGYLYRCIATNNEGSITSETATLTIGGQLTEIISQPISQEADLGEDIYFSLTSIGTNLTYQWQKNSEDLTNGGNISGVTTKNLTISSATTNNEGIYKCIVSGDCGEILISNSAVLSVLTTNIDKYSNNNSINIYPNPSSGKFVLEINSEYLEMTTINIYNPTGKLVYTEINLSSETNNKHNIELTNMLKGIYYIQLIGSNINTTKKLIIE